MNATTQNVENVTLAAFVAQMNERIAFEGKNPCAMTIAKHLSRLSQNEKAFEYFTSVNETFAFINRSVHKGKRFNEKAIVKVFEIAESIARQANCLSNIDDEFVTIMRKNKFRAMTRKALEQKLVDVYKKSINTASTQSSSLINALKVFNLVTESKDDEGNDTYALRIEDERLAFLRK